MTDLPPPQPVLTDAHRQQVAGWRRLFVLMAVVSIASLALNAFQWRSTTGDADERNQLEDCRAKLAAAVTAAQAERDIADDRQTRAIGLVAGVDLPDSIDVDGELVDVEVLPIDQALVESYRAERRLIRAVDARLAFDEHPTGEC